MTNQLTSNAEALRLFFTEDIFLIKDKTEAALAKPVIAAPEVVAKENATLPKVEAPIYQEPVAVLPTVEEPVVAAKPPK